MPLLTCMGSILVHPWLTVLILSFSVSLIARVAYEQSLVLVLLNLVDVGSTGELHLAYLTVASELVTLRDLVGLLSLLDALAHLEVTEVEESIGDFDDLL